MQVGGLQVYDKNQFFLDVLERLTTVIENGNLSIIAATALASGCSHLSPGSVPMC